MKKIALLFFCLICLSACVATNDRFQNEETPNKNSSDSLVESEAIITEVEPINEIEIFALPESEYIKFDEDLIAFNSLYKKVALAILREQNVDLAEVKNSWQEITDQYVANQPSEYKNTADWKKIFGEIQALINTAEDLLNKNQNYDSYVELNQINRVLGKTREENNRLVFSDFVAKVFELVYMIDANDKQEILLNILDLQLEFLENEFDDAEYKKLISDLRIAVQKLKLLEDNVYDDAKKEIFPLFKKWSEYGIDKLI